MAECPECSGEVEVSGKAELGEIFECPDCGAELELKSIKPIKLELAPKEEEDWGE